MHNRGPQLRDFARDLLRIVEASEGDVAALETRGRGDGNVAKMRTVAANHARQAVDVFGKQMLGAGAGHVGIAEEIVHGRHPGCAQHADP